ncbi:MAG: DUF1566 domain-containing protein [Leptospiraceae bacterium]|nr:DUF1566 domain-containing protein [Leptospiraceae bacterium]MCP5496591.1 DUF1566 domain-containing protein [Leptospiraceae bacterium]
MKSNFILKYTSIGVIPFLLLVGLLFSCKANEKNSKKEKTALAAAAILLSQTSCNGSSVSRDWGTFTDCNDGTVKFVGTAGTFGGNSYPAQTLYFTKCVYGQTYNSATNDCDGTSNLGNYGAKNIQFCKTYDNSCDNTITVTSGPLFDACSGLSLTGKSWRVPTKNELKLLVNCANTTNMPDHDYHSCPKTDLLNIINLFPIPSTLRDFYWSSNVYTGSNLGNGNMSYALFVSFDDGYVLSDWKDKSYYALCVSSATYNISGTITGLTADGLVLQNNSGDDLTVSSGATTFAFTTKVSGAYAVTVKTQPTGLTCSVSSGSGTAIADVTNVSISCSSSSSIQPQVVAVVQLQLTAGGRLRTVMTGQLSLWEWLERLVAILIQLKRSILPSAHTDRLTILQPTIVRERGIQAIITEHLPFNTVMQLIVLVTMVQH